jgi:hypothetical protein
MLDDPHFHNFCATLRPGYPVPCPTKARTRLLIAEYSLCMSMLHNRLQQEQHLTVTADGWTDRVKRAILALVVVFIDGSMALLRSLDHSAEEHTGDNIAKHIVKVLQDFNISARVAMLTTDNASAMVRARTIVVSTPGLQHVIPFRQVGGSCDSAWCRRHRASVLCKRELEMCMCRTHSRCCVTGEWDMCTCHSLACDGTCG